MYDSFAKQDVTASTRLPFFTPRSADASWRVSSCGLGDEGPLALPSAGLARAFSRYKILAHMFSRIISNLDQIQNFSTARACVFNQSKIDIAKHAIHDVVEELEAKAESA